MAQFKGEVCWFNNAKGYGFLRSNQTQDVFCHYSAIQKEGYKSLREGEAIEFDVVQGESGRQQAANVVPTGKAEGTAESALHER